MAITFFTHKDAQKLWEAFNNQGMINPVNEIIHKYAHVNNQTIFADPEEDKPVTEGEVI